MHDDDLLAWRAMTPEQHIVTHLGYSMMSVRDLVPYAADDSPLPFEAMAGCRDAFFMHARTVAEFFVRMPKADWTARDFMPGWTPPSQLAGRLERVWLVASKHIAHMSRERVPDLNRFTPEDTSIAGLTGIAADCYRVMATFVARYMQQPSAQHVDAMTGYLRGEITEQWIADYLVLPPYGSTD